MSQVLSRVLITLMLMVYTSLELCSFSFHVESVNSCSRSTFRGIFAVSASEVWIAGSRGVVLKSSDSGGSFRRVIIPDSCGGDFRDIHVINRNTVVLLSIGNGEDSKIYRSSNGGKTWKVVYTNMEPEGFLNSIDFWDSENGIAVGDPVDGRMDVLRTSDGGKTWKRIKGPQALKGEAGFAASGTCVRTLGKKHAWMITGGRIDHTRVYRSRNRGKTWDMSVSPVLSGKMSAGLFSVAFINEKRGIVVGGDYIKEDSSIKTFALTEDGGKSWIGSDDFNPVFQSATGVIKFEGKDFIITAGPKGVYLTNGRNSWKKISGYGYHCLSVTPDRKAVWFAGSKGRIGRMLINED